MHRMLARLFYERGVEMKRTSQLNVGGNMDFYNMLERERLESKKISKTQAVTSIMGHELPRTTSTSVPRTTCRGSPTASGRTSGSRARPSATCRCTLEAKLEVWDSPNSAGIVIDAVRCCKLALNHGLGGPITGASAYLMKSPPEQHPDPVAREMVEDFIAQYGGAPKLPGQKPARRRPRRRSHARRPSIASRATLSPRRRAAPCSAVGPASRSPRVPYRSPRSRRGPGSTTTRSTGSSSGSRMSCARAGTASSYRAVRLARADRAVARPSGRCADPRRLGGEGCASVLAVGQSLPFRDAADQFLPVGRVEDARGAARARRARLPARARAVRAQRGVGGAPALARAQRRARSTRRPSASSRHRSRARWLSSSSAASTGAPPATPPHAI